MTNSAPPGAGEAQPPTAEDRVLDELRNAVTPAKSLDRTTATTNLLVGSVGLIGTAVTFAGFTTIEEVASRQPARLLAMVSAAGALIAVVIALSTALIRVREVRWGNLEDYRDHLAHFRRKGHLLRLAGILLIASIIIEAVAAAFAVGTDSEPVLSLSADHASVRFSVTDEDEASGSPGIIRLSGVSNGNDVGDLVLLQKVAASADRTISAEGEVAASPRFESFVLKYVDPEGSVEVMSVSGVSLRLQQRLQLERLATSKGGWIAKAAVELVGQEPGLPVTVLVDETASATTPAGGRGETRFEAAGLVDADGQFELAAEVLIQPATYLALRVSVAGNDLEPRILAPVSLPSPAGWVLRAGE